LLPLRARSLGRHVLRRIRRELLPTSDIRRLQRNWVDGYSEGRRMVLIYPISISHYYLIIRLIGSLRIRSFLDTTNPIQSNPISINSIPNTMKYSKGVTPLWISSVMFHSITTSFPLVSYSRRGTSTTFVPSTTLIPLSSSSSDNNTNNQNNNNQNKKKENKGKNWIEQSSPLGISMPSNTASSNDPESLSASTSSSESLDYTLGIDGESYSVGPLSLQVYDALISVAAQRFPNQQIPSELQDIYKLYAMDVTAKEATQLALQQNGLQRDILTVEIEDGGEEQWGDVEYIQMNGQIFDSPEEAVQMGQWTPGISFSFVVRNVRAKEKELDLKELLQAIDPDGTIREELDSREDAPEYGYDPVQDIQSLKELAIYNEKRCNDVTRDIDSYGYVKQNGDGMRNSVIPLEDIILNDDDGET